MKRVVEVVSMKTLRMVMTRSRLIFIFCLMCNGLIAQQLIPMGGWRSHFNYQQTSLVERTTNNVFAATSHGLLYYDPQDQSVNKLSKVDGLNDVGISAMAFDQDEEYLVLGYQNGNVDLINSDGITNLPILYNSGTTEDKHINHIDFHDGNIHLSTNFGMLILTVENTVQEAYLNLGETGETIKINASLVSNDKLYLATEDGILEGQINSGINLQDFNNWERFSGSLVEFLDLNSIVAGHGNIYTASVSGLFKLNDNNWSGIPITLQPGETILKIKSGEEAPIVLTSQRILLLSSDDSFSTVDRPDDANILDIYQEDNNLFWYADESKGLSRLQQGTADHIVLDGPSTQLVRLKIDNDHVYAFPQLNTNYNSTVSNGMGYSVFMDGRWQIIGPENLDDFSNITDVVTIDNEIFLTSFGNGIINLSTGEVTDRTNSPLVENESDTGNTLVSGILEDNEENIWITNFSNNSLLKWDGADGWVPYDFGSSASSEPVKSGINQSNQIWMTLGLQDGRGLLGFDITSETYRYVSAVATGLPSDQVYDLAFGKQDEIWLATDQGLAYFPFSFGVIEDHTIDVSLPVFEESILFENKPVYALAVDGGNRIWIGTDDGLWLFSENIQELVYHFDVENSPLPSNKIVDLEIDPNTGELFVLTDKGLVSYRTNATEGSNRHQNVEIYPNPVLPDFTGWVGFSGLAENVRLKVTTISGKLVREINAFGGGASWDVNDYNGRRVDSGVYLVFSASSDGSETFVGKVAILK